MTTLIPVAVTCAASFAWLAAIDDMTRRHEPIYTRFFAYCAFVAVVLFGGFGIVQVHQQVEQVNQVLAAVLYCGIELAAGIVGVNAWKYWRV